MAGFGVGPARQLVGQHHEVVGDDQIQLAAGPIGSVPGSFFAHGRVEARIIAPPGVVDISLFIRLY
jgi:hypothetical protein